MELGGLINDVIVLAVFIYFLLLITRKIKLGAESQQKVDKLLEEKGRLVKIVIYSGVLAFSVLTVVDLVAFLG